MLLNQPRLKRAYREGWRDGPALMCGRCSSTVGAPARRRAMSRALCSAKATRRGGRCGSGAPLGEGGDSGAFPSRSVDGEVVLRVRSCRVPRGATIGLHVALFASDVCSPRSSERPTQASVRIRMRGVWVASQLGSSPKTRLALEHIVSLEHSEGVPATPLLFGIVGAPVITASLRKHTYLFEPQSQASS